MLLCNVCGAEGEESFSKTDEGTLVCDLCGTQSFLQIRNETQDVDDSGGIGQSKVQIYQRRKNTKRGPKVKIRPYTLEDCLIACQRILYRQTTILVEKKLCPVSIIHRTKQLWFRFLHTWEEKGERPLLECFSDYCTRQSSKEGQDDDSKIPERKSTLRDRNFQRKDAQARLNRFTISHLYSIIYLACRYEGMGIFPADVARWGMHGTLPTFHAYHEILSMEQQEVLAPVRQFFIWSNSHPKASVIDANAAYLEYNCALSCPSLNVPLLCWRLVDQFNLPRQVFETFCLLSGTVSSVKDLPLHCGSSRSNSRLKNPVDPHHSILGIVAYVIVAIKLCPGWQHWSIIEANDQFFVPWSKDELDQMPRKHLSQYTQFCHNVVGMAKYIPPSLQQHVESLVGNDTADRTTTTTNTSKMRYRHPVAMFQPCYDPKNYEMTTLSPDQALLHQNPKHSTRFYPLYHSSQPTLRYHAVFEKIVQLLCEWTDTRISHVMTQVEKLDKVLRRMVRRPKNYLEESSSQMNRKKPRVNIKS